MPFGCPLLPSDDAWVGLYRLRSLDATASAAGAVRRSAHAVNGSYHRNRLAVSKKLAGCAIVMISSADDVHASAMKQGVATMTDTLSGPAAVPAELKRLLAGICWSVHDSSVC